MRLAGITRIPAMTPMSVSTLRSDQSPPKIPIPTDYQCALHLRVPRTELFCRKHLASQQGISAVPLGPLPHAAKSHCNCLAVHSPGRVTAQERNHLRDLARFQHPIRRVEGSALAPHLLDANAAPFGLRLC